MRKVHQAKSHVFYMYWIDTVYVQNNLPSELVKGQFTESKEKYAKSVVIFHE